MTRYSVLKVINPILALLLLNQLLTGLLADKLSHEAFEILHEGGGIILAITATLHLALNWNWVKGAFFSKPGVRT